MARRDRRSRSQPRQPVAEFAQKTALAASPPIEKDRLAKPDLMDLATLDPERSNSTSATPPITTSSTNRSTPPARAFLQRPAAEALLKVHQGLAKDGFGLMIHDGYRPWYVTKMFWGRHAPTPSASSSQTPIWDRATIAAAPVDLTLYELKTGKAVNMPGGLRRVFPIAPIPTTRAALRSNAGLRDLLRKRMEGGGLHGPTKPNGGTSTTRDWKKYPIQKCGRSSRWRRSSNRAFS